MSFNKMENIDTYIQNIHTISSILKNSKMYIIKELNIQIINIQEEYINIIKDDNIKKPDYFKMMMIEDMKQLKININKYVLRKYKFTNFEINWLIQNNIINDDTKY